MMYVSQREYFCKTIHIALFTAFMETLNDTHEETCRPLAGNLLITATYTDGNLKWHFKEQENTEILAGMVTSEFQAME